MNEDRQPRTLVQRPINVSSEAECINFGFRLFVGADKGAASIALNEDTGKMSEILLLIWHVIGLFKRTVLQIK